MVFSNNGAKFHLLAATLATTAVAIIQGIKSKVDDFKSNSESVAETSTNADVAILVIASFILVAIAIGILISLVLAQVWPVGVTDLLRVLRGHPGSLFELANKSRGHCDFWSIRSKIFWGERSVILTSEKAVRDVLLNANVFERTMPNPTASVTSCHTVLGAPGGSSLKWKRLRSVCNPFFDDAEFESRTSEAINHIIAAVKTAIKNSPPDGLDYFQLINRLVVEIHLLLLLGVDKVPTNGMYVQNPMVEKGVATDTVCLADAIDASLNIGLQGHSPCYTSSEFAPLLNYLSERLQLPLSELGGIERILAEAQKSGEVTTLERLHNLCMYMIALAPSPAAFWSTVHTFRDESLLKDIRDEADAGEFTVLSMVFKEALRMYSPVPIMIQRYCVKDKAPVCLGQSLVKGDHVVVPTIIIQNDPSLWVGPDDFRPDRWDDGKTIDTLKNNKRLRMKMKCGSGMECRPNNEMSKDKARCKDKARYFPFGMGQHTCLGQPYAVWLSMTISSTIINHFDVEISDPEGMMEESPSYKRIRDHIYSFPKHPLKAKITALNDELGDRRSMAFRKTMTKDMNRVSMFVGGDGASKGRKFSVTTAMMSMRAVGAEMESEEEMSD